MKLLAQLWNWFAPRGWAVALMAMVVLVATDTFYHGRMTWELSWGAAAPQPLPDANSPSGYAGNQHVLILPYTGIDGYHWILQTQQMLAGGGARIRDVSYDNAPDGREVHWASGLRWWMALLAWLDHVYRGTPLPQAVEEIAPFASTLLVVILIAFFTPVLARRAGSAAAALFAFGAVGVGPFYESFAEGRLDHHGLAALCALLTVLLPAVAGAGWVRNSDFKSNRPASLLSAWLPDQRQARRWFIAAGVVGGIGLWTSAASEVFIIAETGLGGLLAVGLVGRGAQANEEAQLVPSLWRAWGWSGAATSLFFYLLEYFPSHLGMRLEVNHPLYALAWAGGGEMIFRLGRWWAGGPLAAGARGWLWLLGSVVAAGLPLAVIAVAGDRVFSISDHFLWVMHNDYIEEFFTLYAFLKSQWQNQQYFVLLLFANPLVLLAAPMLWGGFGPSVPRPLRAMLWTALPAGLVTFGFCLAQVRWIELDYSVWLAALVVVALVVRLHPGWRWTWPRVLIAVVFLSWGILANPAFIVKTWVDTARTQPVWRGDASQVEVLQQIARDSAERLRQRVGDQNTIVLSGATSSTWLTFYGGFQAVGTYYWENLAGLKAAAAIYGADPASARQLLAARGVNYIVTFSFVDVPEEYTRLARGLRATEPAPTDAMLMRLKQGQMPEWLRPIAYPVPEQFRNQMVVSMYEFVPNQSAEDAMVALAQLQMDNNRADAAQTQLVALLSQDPNYIPALIKLALIQLAGPRPAEAMDTLRRLLEIVPQARVLDLGDRVDFAAALSRLQDQSLMRAQLEIAVHEADSASLRRLRPQSLYNLLMLARGSGLLAERPGLWPAGLELLPKLLQLQLLMQSADAARAAGHAADALVLLRQAAAKQPDAVALLNRLVFLLAASRDDSVRNGQEALAVARHAYDLDKGQHAGIADALACAYAETGDFAQAVDWVQKALVLAQKENSPELINALQQHLALFQARQPYRE